MSQPCSLAVVALFKWSHVTALVKPHHRFGKVAVCWSRLAQQTPSGRAIELTVFFLSRAAQLTALSSSEGSRALVKEAVLLWRKRCSCEGSGALVKEAVLLWRKLCPCEGSGALVKEEVLLWRKRSFREGSGALVKEAELCRSRALVKKEEL